MIKDIGGRISMSPPLEMAMAHGYARGAGRARSRHTAVAELRSRHHGRAGLLLDDAHDVQPAAATASCSAAATSEEDTPPLLTCRDVLDFATLQGARCANIDHKVGTLTPGKEADILMLRADRARHLAAQQCRRAWWRI